MKTLYNSNHWVFVLLALNLYYSKLCFKLLSFNNENRLIVNIARKTYYIVPIFH